MDLLEFPTALPQHAAHPGLSIVPRRGALWRVARADGLVLGYVERIDAADARDPRDAGRYRSKRMMRRAAGFTVVGEFASPDDAVDALRS